MCVYCVVLEMLEQRSSEFKTQLAKEKEELTKATTHLKNLTERETALAHQNAKMSVELVAADKQQQGLQSELKCLRKELNAKDSQLSSAREEMKSLHSKTTNETETLQKTSEQQSKLLKEYQEKVIE